MENQNLSPKWTLLRKASRDEIVRRVKAMRNTSGRTPEEAATFRQRATEIAARHGIKEHELSGNTPEPRVQNRSANGSWWDFHTDPKRQQEKRQERPRSNEQARYNSGEARKKQQAEWMRHHGETEKLNLQQRDAQVKGRKRSQDSMRRRAEGIDKLMQHHGYTRDPKINSEHSRTGMFRNYIHPEGHQVHIDTRSSNQDHNISLHAPPIKWSHWPKGGGRVVSSHKNWKGDNYQSLPLKEKMHPLRRLDEHLSQLHGTKPFHQTKSKATPMPSEANIKPETLKPAASTTAQPKRNFFSRVMGKSEYPSRPAAAGSKLPYPLEGNFPKPQKAPDHPLHKVLQQHGYRHVESEQRGRSVRHDYKHDNGDEFMFFAPKNKKNSISSWHHFPKGSYDNITSSHTWDEHEPDETKRLTPQYISGFIKRTTNKTVKSWSLIRKAKEGDGLVAHKIDTENALPSWFYLRPAKTDKFKPAPGTAMNHAVKFKHPSKGHVMVVGPSHGAIHQHLDKTTYKNLPREEGHADKQNNFYAKNWHRSVLRTIKSENVKKAQIIPITGDKLIANRLKTRLPVTKEGKVIPFRKKKQKEIGGPPPKPFTNKSICSLCQDKYLIRVIYKNDGIIRKGFRNCPLCNATGLAIRK